MLWPQKRSQQSNCCVQKTYLLGVQMFRGSIVSGLSTSPTILYFILGNKKKRDKTLPSKSTEFMLLHLIVWLQIFAKKDIRVNTAYILLESIARRPSFKETLLKKLFTLSSCQRWTILSYKPFFKETLQTVFSFMVID